MTLADVVINQGDGFEPTQYSIEPLSVVAVVCNGKLTYGVWADTNALGSMGEASVYLGRVCYGSQINGNYGHSDADVLYIAFPGGKDKTVPDQQGKDHASMFALGKKLVEAAFGGDGGEEEEGTAKGGDGTMSASSAMYTTPTGNLEAGAGATVDSQRLSAQLTADLTSTVTTVGFSRPSSSRCVASNHVSEVD
ncbi:glycoside hydrolase family 75 protein [Rhodotorula paludigena]|uniref:glycoside hydrolase family 75 protein n=1 Tax=Rhodotorula paludigena TaxID=86838 RepID=UPI003172B23D